jgi:conflict system STAND superfamily ATPase/trypsin-like peptidase
MSAVSGGALDRSLFAVRDTAGMPVGVAFLVALDIAVTCAHVVSQALDGTAATEGTELVLDQPLAAEGLGRQHSVRVERLLPEKPGGAGDIAILRLTQAPADARAVRLVDAQDLWGHSVRTFGFPARRDLGVWHNGVLRGRQAAGWIQADAAGPTGYPIGPGFSGAPVWDDELAGVVGMVVAADTSAASAGYVIPTEWLLDAWPDLRTDAIPPSPYRGLLPFRDVDQEFFFGRQAQSDELADQVSGRPIFTVIGASGSGKTSLVQAGVVPRLRARGIAVAVMRAGDGSAPINALAAALGPLLEPGRSETERLAEQPALAALITEHGLSDVVPRVLAATDTRRLVIVLDQAEQLLEQPPDAVGTLLEVLFPDPPPAALGVVLTLRADHLDAALRHDKLAGPLGRDSYLLSAMTPEQIAEAVAGPVERVRGVDFEPGLAERIVADAGSDPGVLPLLGNTLTLLWQRQQGGVVTHRAYDELGQLSGSLARYAEEIWTGIPATERKAARRLFLALVRISRDGRRSSRRTVTEQELGEQGWSLAQRLVTTRVIVAGRDAEGRPTVELAHDALIDHWTRLRDWVDADREFRIWQDELRNDHTRWQRAGQQAELLLRGDPLRTARSWLAQRSADLTAPERDFIAASVQGHRSSGQRRRVRIVVFASVLVLALVATLLAVIRDRAVRAEQAVATSRAFSAAADGFYASDQMRSALLALAAYRESPTVEARQTLFRNYLNILGAETALSGERGKLSLGKLGIIDFTRDGRVVVALSIAAQGADQYLTVWTREPGKPVRITRLEADPSSRSVRVTNDGGTLLLTGNDGIDRIDLLTGERRKIIGISTNDFLFQSSIADDSSVAVATVGGRDVAQRVVAWDLRTGRVIVERPTPPMSYGLPLLRLAPDLHSLVVEYSVVGRQSAADGGLHRAEVWDMLSGRTRILEDSFSDGKVTPEGMFIFCEPLLSTDLDLKNTFIVRRLADGTEIARGRFRGSCTPDLLLDRSGTLAVLGSGESLNLVDLKSGRTRGILKGLQGPQAYLSPIGEFTDARGRNLVLVRNSAGTIQMIPIQPHGVTHIKSADYGTTKLAPNGQFLVSISPDGRLLQVTPSEGGDPIAEVSRPIPPAGKKYQASTVFSPDSSLLAHRVSPDRVMLYRLPRLDVESEIVTSPTNADTDSGDLFFDRAGRLITRIGAEVTCWDPRTGSTRCHLDLARLGTVPAGQIPHVSPLDDPNQLLVVVPGGTTVLTIDTSTGLKVNSFEVGADVVGAVRQRNSPYLVVLRKNSAIELWDVDKHHRVLGPLREAGPPPFQFVDLRQAGSIMISTQNRVALWRTGNDSPTYSLQLPGGQTGVDASADGSRLLVMTASAHEGSAVVIDLRSEAWADRICHVIAGRELTPDELVGLPALSKTGPLCPP